MHVGVAADTADLRLCNVRKVSFDPWVVTIGRLGRGVGGAARQRTGPTKAVTCKALDFRLIFNDVHGGPKNGATVFYGL